MNLVFLSRLSRLFRALRVRRFGLAGFSRHFGLRRLPGLRKQLSIQD